MWASADNRAKLWLQLFIVQTFLLAVSVAGLYRVLTAPPLVYRVGCDGIPVPLTLNEAVYSEPQETELRSFAAHAALKLMRLDSYSIVNDVLETSKWMTPEGYGRWEPELQTLVKGVEDVKRRANVDEQTLSIDIDKKAWPWIARVRGERRILTDRDEAVKIPNQPFEVTFEIVTTTRTPLNPWGLLVNAFRTQGTLLQVATRTREG